jgi:hypothetical protein
MSKVIKLYGLASMAGLAIMLAAISEGAAQEQSDQDQSSQNDQQQGEQSQQQSAQQAQKNQQEEQQRQQQELERQRQQERQQQERQRQEQERQQQSQQRDQQNRDRDQSSGRDSDSSQGGLGVGVSGDGRDGVVVSHVHSGSPAEEMGIRTGDRITAVNGQQVQSVQQFIARIRNMDPGQQIELDIRRARGGDRQTLQGELESRSEALAEHQNRGDWSDQQRRTRRDDRYASPDRGDRQNSYDERRDTYSQDYSDQMSGSRLDQIERQVDGLGRQINEIRVALERIRRDLGQSTQWNRDRTARYEEYQGTTRQREYDGRVDGRETNRDSGRSGFDRGTGTSQQRGSRSNDGDTDTDTAGGETGEDRLHVGSEDARE